MSIQCSNCGAANHNSAKFCPSCGTSLARTCAACGTGNSASARFCKKCGIALTGSLAPAEATGLLEANNLLAGRYLIVKKVGEGGMGAVYKTIDTRLGNKVLAVKEMSDGAITSALDKQRALQLFKQEAQMLAMLNHPYLPRVTDHFSEGGKQYLVMDFVEGHSLAQLLEQASGPLDVEQVLTWAKQLCDVLDYLHNQQPPIIFRDLKPANIMLDQDGKIKLIDFGIARIFKSGKTTDTTYFGTTGYAPPEQYGGKGQTDARSDIYALGACLHQLLTGHEPSRSPLKFATVRSLNPNVPQAIDQAIMRALEFTADQRWQSAEEMRDALMGRERGERHASFEAASEREGEANGTLPSEGVSEGVSGGEANGTLPSAGSGTGGEGAGVSGHLSPDDPSEPTSKPSEPIIAPEELIERKKIEIETEIEIEAKAVPPKPTRASNRAFIATVVVTAGISAAVGIAIAERNSDLILATLALWFMVGPLAYMLTRRPGAAFLAYSLNLLALVLLTPGPTTSARELMALIMPGIVMEAVLAFGGYDNRRYWAVVLASVLAMLALIMAFWLVAGTSRTSPPSSELALFILGATVSGFIIGSIAYGIGRVLRK